MTRPGEVTSAQQQPTSTMQPTTTELVSDARAAIEVVGLTKRFGRHVAVDDLSMTVPAGTITGLVGPNGAGKTTTMRMLLGLVAPNAGVGTVLGQPLGEPSRYLQRVGALGEPSRYLQRVGALIESPAFYPSLTGRQNLRLLARLGGVDAARLRRRWNHLTRRGNLRQTAQAGSVRAALPSAIVRGGRLRRVGRRVAPRRWSAHAAPRRRAHEERAPCGHAS